MKSPRVFVSYSHDSTTHKKWVLEFSTTLRNQGVDAVLDQWDLKPGDDLPHFMESQLEKCDFSLMICTDQYVSKANTGEGGVGYEKMIMTSSLLSKIDSNKVIPIIRQNGTNIRPTFLKSKLYVDFSNDDSIDSSFNDLLRVLLDAPLYKKPKIGTNPYESIESPKIEPPKLDRTLDGTLEVMLIISSAYNNTNNSWAFYSYIVKSSTMQKLTLDRNLRKAENQGFIDRPFHNRIYITKKGKKYLYAKGIEVR